MITGDLFYMPILLLATALLLRGSIPHWLFSIPRFRPTDMDTQTARRIVGENWTGLPIAILSSLFMLFLLSLVDVSGLIVVFGALIGRIPLVGEYLGVLLTEIPGATDADLMALFHVQIVVVLSVVSLALLTWLFMDCVHLLIAVNRLFFDDADDDGGRFTTRSLAGPTILLREILSRPAMRNGTRAALLGLLLLIGGLPVWRPLTARVLDPETAAALWTGLINLPWAPVWLLLVEAVRLGCRPAIAPRFEREVEAGFARVGYDLIAPSLWRKALLKHGDEVLYHQPPRPAVRAGTDDAPRTVDIKDRLERYLRGAEDLVINEALHRRHLDIIVDMAKVIRDRGAGTVLICPDYDRDPVYEALQHARSSRWTVRHVGIRKYWAFVTDSHGLSPGGEQDNQTATIWVVGERELPDFITALIDTAEAIASPLERRPRLSLDRLGQMVILNFDQLDLSALRLQFTRLLAAGQDLRRLRICVHGFGWRNPDMLSVAEDALQPIRESRPFSKMVFMSPLSDCRQRTHVVVWRGDAETAASFDRAYGVGRSPMSPALAVVAAYGEHAEKAKLIDRDLVVPDDLRSRLVKSGGLPGKLGRLERRHPIQIPADADGLAPGEPSIVVVATDAPLSRLMGRRYGDAMSGHSMICNLVLKDYPLRDYHLSVLKSEPFEDFVERWAPTRAPTIRGGVKELLAALTDELRRDTGPEDPRRRRGLRREDVADRFLERLPDRLRRRLKVTATCAGIQTLYRRFERNGNAYEVRAETGPDGEHRLYLQNAPTRPSVDLGEAKRLIEPADWLLVHAPRQEIVVAGERWQFDGKGRLIRPSAASGDLLPRTAAHLVYTLRYDNDQDADTTDYLKHSEHDQPTQSGARRFVVWELSLSTTRRMDGFYRYDDGTRLFGDRGQAFGCSYRDLSHQPVDNTVRNFLQAAWHIRLFRLREEPLAPELLAKVAFAIAVLFQDYLRVTFSNRTHRLMVMSPQAAAHQRKAMDPEAAGQPQGQSDDVSDLDRFLLRSYPRLDTTAQTPGTDEFRWMGGQNGTGEAEGTTLDLIVLEDSDVDLGMVRTLHHAEDSILASFDQYVDWLEDNDWPDRYHRFGAECSPRCLNFALVREFLPRRTTPGLADWVRWDDPVPPRWALTEDLQVDPEALEDDDAAGHDHTVSVGSRRIRERVFGGRGP